jgi:hypothetical protein
MSVDEKVGPQPRVLGDSLDMPQPAGAPCAAGPSGIAGARASLAAAGRAVPCHRHRRITEGQALRQTRDGS